MTKPLTKPLSVIISAIVVAVTILGIGLFLEITPAPSEKTYTYLNTKHNYKFEYPATHKVLGFEGMGSLVPVKPDSDLVLLVDKSEQYVFQVNYYDPAETRFPQDLIDAKEPYENRQPIEIFGSKGYKIPYFSADTNSPVEIEYVLLRPEGVFSITEVQNNTNAQKAFSTFEFVE